MSLATVTRMAADPQGELEDELRHIRDLVLVRDLLRRRGADAAELRECDATIAEARARLAESAKRAYAPAA